MVPPVASGGAIAFDVTQVKRRRRRRLSRVSVTRTGVAVINKITWQKAGRVSQPGRYMFTFGWLTVTAEDLRVWAQFPQAAFTLVKLPDGDGVTDEFHLGTFEIPLEHSPAAAHDSHGEA